MVNSAFLSRPGWETHIESESDDYFYMLPKEVSEILVIVEATTKGRILIGIKERQGAKTIHRAIEAAKAVNNMLLRDNGGLLTLLSKHSEAVSNIKSLIYGWAENYIKRPSEGQILLVDKQLLKVERSYKVAADFFAHLSELETIRVSDTTFGETDLLQLSELVSQLPPRQIQKVEFRRCVFCDEAPLRQAFGFLGKCDRIQEIVFEDCQLSDSHLPEFKNLWLLVPTLKIFRITRNESLTGEYYLRDFIVDICTSTLSLEVLDLSRNGIDDLVTSALHESIWALRLRTKLGSLNLSYNRISSREAQTIFKLHQHSGSTTSLAVLPYTEEDYVNLPEIAQPPAIVITPAIPKPAPPQPVSASPVLELLTSSTSLPSAVHSLLSQSSFAPTHALLVAPMLKEYIRDKLLQPTELGWKEYSHLLRLAESLGYVFQTGEKTLVLQTKGRVAKVMQGVKDALNFKLTDLSKIQELIEEVFQLQLEGDGVEVLKLTYQLAVEKLESYINKKIDPDLIELSLLSGEPFILGTQNKNYRHEVTGSTWGWTGLGEEYLDYERLAHLSRSELISSLEARPEEFDDKQSQMLGLRRSTFMLSENTCSLYPYYKIDTLLCMARTISRYRWMLRNQPSITRDVKEGDQSTPIEVKLAAQGPDYRSDPEFASCLKQVCRDFRTVKREDIALNSDLDIEVVKDTMNRVCQAFSISLDPEQVQNSKTVNDLPQVLESAAKQILELGCLLKTSGNAHKAKSWIEWLGSDNLICLTNLTKYKQKSKDSLNAKLLFRLALVASRISQKEAQIDLLEVLTSSEILGEEEIWLELLRFILSNQDNSNPLLYQLVQLMSLKPLSSQIAYIMFRLSPSFQNTRFADLCRLCYTRLFFPELPTVGFGVSTDSEVTEEVSFAADAWDGIFISAKDKQTIPIRARTPKRLIDLKACNLHTSRRIFSLEYLLKSSPPNDTSGPSFSPDAPPGTSYPFSWRGFWLDGAQLCSEGVLVVTCAGLFLYSKEVGAGNQLQLMVAYSEIIDIKPDLQQLVLVLSGDLKQQFATQSICLRVECGVQIAEDIVSHMLLELRRPRRVAWAWSFLTSISPMRAMELVFANEAGTISKGSPSPSERSCVEGIWQYAKGTECQEGQQPLAHSKQFLESLSFEQLDCNSHGTFAYILEEHLTDHSSQEASSPETSDNEDDAKEMKDHVEQITPRDRQPSQNYTNTDGQSAHLNTPRRSSVRRGSRLDNLLQLGSEPQDSVTRSINKMELAANLGEDSKALGKLIPDGYISARSAEESAAIHSAKELETLIQNDLVGKSNTEVMESSISNALKSFPGKKKKLTS